MKNNRFRKIIVWIILSPFILFLLLCIFIYLPPVQRVLVEKATVYASQATGMNISVGRLSLSFPIDVVISDVDVLSEAQDTLLSVGEVKVDVQLWPLLKQEVEIDGVSLKNGYVDSKHLLPDMVVKGKLGELFLASHGVDLQTGTAIVNKIELQNTDLSVKLFPSEDVDTTETAPLDWAIELHELAMKNVAFTFSQPVDSLNLQFSVQKGELKEGLVDLRTMNCALEQLVLKKGTFGYGSEEAGWHFKDINFDAESLLYEGRKINAKINRFDAKEKGGFELLETKGELHADSMLIRIPGIKMKTRHSWLDMEGQAEWALLDMKKSGNLSGRLQMQVAKEDALKLIRTNDEQLIAHYPEDPFTVDCKVQGNMRHLSIDTCSVQWPGVFSLGAGGKLKHLTDSLNRGGTINLQALMENGAFMRAWTDRVAIPTGTLLNGYLQLDGPRVETDILLKTQKAVGIDSMKLAKDFKMKHAARLHAHYHLSEEAYAVDLAVNELNLHDFLPKDSLFKISAYLHADGLGTNPLSPKTRLQLEGGIKEIQYTNYRFTNYDCQAKLEKGLINLDLTAKNAITDLNMNLAGELEEKHLDARLKMEINKLNWKLLNLSPMDMQTSHNLDLNVKSDLKGMHQLEATLSDSYVKVAKKKRFKSRDLQTAFSTSNDSTHFTLNAGDLDLRFHSMLPVETLAAKFTDWMGKLQTQWEAKKINQQELATMWPHTDFSLTMGDDNPISDYLHLMHWKYKHVDLQLGTSSVQGLNAKLYIDHLKKDSLAIDSAYLHLTQSAEGLNLLSGIKSLTKKDGKPFESSLSASANNDKLQLLLQHLNHKKEKGIYLGLNAELAPKGIKMSLYPEKPILLYRPFTLNKDNFIFYTEKGRVYGNVRLYDEIGTGVNFYTSADTSAVQDMSLALAHLGLEEIGNVFPYFPDMQGWLGADIHYLEDKGKTMLSGDLQLDEFVFEENKLGNWAINGVYLPDDEHTHRVDGFVHHNDNEVVRWGGVYRTADEHKNVKDSLQADLELLGFPMTVINPFIPDHFMNFEGQLDGAMSVAGHLSSPEMNGQATFKDVFINVPEMSAKFRLEENPLEVKENQLHFNQYKIYTMGKTPFIIDGSLDFSELDAMQCNFKLKADNYELLNAPKNKNAVTYGKIYVDVDAQVHGLLSEMVMRGNMNVLGTTDFTYVLKDSPLAVNDRLGDMVSFVDFNDTLQVENPVLEPIQLKGVDIGMTIHIDQAVQAHVQLTPDNSNYMTLEGGGDLSFLYTPQGEMKLSGRYSLMSGEMQYSIPIIPLKKFSIRNGSYMNWTGNMMNPQLNVKATEKVRATVGNDDGSSRMVTFDVGIQLTNRLENLGMAFTLEAPQDGTLQDELARLSAEERGKLAVTMLVTGMYLGGGNSAKGFDMNNALNSFLQGQISNIVGQSLDVSLGMETTDNGGVDGGKQTDYNFQFAKRFWNNRFRVVIGGTVSTGKSSTQKTESFINNVSIEYRLDNSGTRYVKLFHNKNYENVFEGEVIETGAGVVLRKKMSNLSELFIFKRKKKNENTDDKK